MKKQQIVSLRKMNKVEEVEEEIEEQDTVINQQ